MKLKYRTDIDGLRALAVILVVLYHAGLCFPGGFIGVDVFFVISGFLITRIILDGLERQQFSLSQFWTRRVKRLMPAFFVLLVFTTVTSWLILLPHQLKELGEVLLAQPLLLTNFLYVRILEFGYFGSRSQNYPLLHTWSLAVEEQFYVVLPVLLLFSYRRSKPQRLVRGMIVIALLAYLLSVFLTPRKPVLAFFLLPTRAFELLVGAVAGQSRWTLGRGGRELASAVGTLLICLCAFQFNESTEFPGWRVAIPTLGTALVLVGNEVGTTMVARLLSLRPVVFTGQISYSLYLWHWPLIAFMQYSLLWSRPWAWTTVLLSFILGGLSWRYVEQPFRGTAYIKSSRSALCFFLSCSCVLIIAGLILYLSDGQASRVPPRALKMAEAETDLGNFRYQHSVEDLQRGNLLRFGDSKLRPQVTVWGDSHAMAVLPALDQVCKKLKYCGEAATHSSSPPLDCQETSASRVLASNHNAWVAAAREHLRRSSPRIVILVARWEEYSSLPGFSEGIEQTLRELRKLPSCRVGLLLQVPRHRLLVPRALALSIWHPVLSLDFQLPANEQNQRTAAFQQQLARLDLGELQFIDPNSLLIKDQKCLVEWSEGCLYRDDNHLSATGSQILNPLFEEFLKRNSEPPQP